MVTSNAVVGSSAISSEGSFANAIAIITRWRCPPESSCGYEVNRLPGSSMPTFVNNSITLFFAAPPLKFWCKSKLSEICFSKV